MDRTDLQEAPIYCEDCRFYMGPTVKGIFSTAQCSRPRETQPIELVSRSVPKQHRYCENERAGESGDRCGPNAIRFEAKVEVAKVAAE